MTVVGLDPNSHGNIKQWFYVTVLIAKSYKSTRLIPNENPYFQCVSVSKKESKLII